RARVAGQRAQFRKHLGGKQHRRAARTAVRRRRDRLAAALLRREQRGDDGRRGERLVAERHEGSGRPRLERGGADGDRGALPVLRPRVHEEAAGEAGEGAAQARVVLACDDDAVADVREHELDAPADDGLALEVEKELLAAHARGEGRRVEGSSDHGVTEGGGGAGGGGGGGGGGGLEVGGG